MDTLPFVLIVLGATGDLTKRKLLPALYHLSRMGSLPEEYQLIAFARRPFSDDEYRNLMRGEVAQFYRHGIDDASWAEFARHIVYQQGEFHEAKGYEELAARLDQLSARGSRVCANKLFYLAVNPAYHEIIFQNLAQVELNEGCGEHGEWTRVIIEKPFGIDLASAKQLNKHLLSIFKEEQIFRIDHYLGKETVQNILAFRFANGLFEPTWCRDYVDNVQVTVAEEIGIENRGEYYDATGALRDVAQNHLLQLFALVAMDEPADLSADAIRDAKVRALESIVLPQDVEREVVKGQYGAGGLQVAGISSLFGHPGESETTDRISGSEIIRDPIASLQDDKPLQPATQSLQPATYRQEPKVDPHSNTETFVAMKLAVDNEKWRGVPFYLRTGKRLRERVTEVNIEFKKLPADLFGKAVNQASASDGSVADTRRAARIVSNVLTLRIQPNEGISLRMNVKEPGLKMQLQPVRMEFCYRNVFNDQPDAYERLLLDAVAGDQTLFLRDDEVEASWRYITPILEAWQQDDGEPELYEAGSWGPAGADELLKKDGREWLSHQIATCPTA